jgi:hypothetical protein
MAGRAHLDQRLEKALLRLFQLQPDSFPVLVSQKEVPSPKASQSLCELPVLPIEIQVFTLSGFPVFGTGSLRMPSPELQNDRNPSKNPIPEPKYDKNGLNCDSDHGTSPDLPVF